jgi:hypothetical protein
MNIPTREEAHRLLQNAEISNPGPWIDHSKYVAIAAESIANHYNEIIPNNAYVLGLLHDIGRYIGVTDLRHTIDGYKYLLDLKYADAARICITHSYPIKDPNAIISKSDYTEEEFEWLKQYLSSIEYDIYDHLIQLCDALAMPTGICLLEKRLIDVAMRYPINEYAKQRWKVFFEIKNNIEKEIGQSIYKILPGVIENTFGINP